MSMYISQRFPSLVEAVLEKRRQEQLEAARLPERQPAYLREEYRKKIIEAYDADTVEKEKQDALIHAATQAKQAILDNQHVDRPARATKPVYDPDVIKEIEEDLYGPANYKKKADRNSKVVPISRARRCPFCLKHFPFELHDITCKTITGK